jgi:2-dehydro-3-deoxy-D-arabinonate dehydratase
MQLAKVRLAEGTVRLGLAERQAFHLLALENAAGVRTLSDVLHADDPAALARACLDRAAAPLALADLNLLAPIDQQEVWAAGVPYKRSREARERESAGAARFYDLVYTAARPELFFKALPHHVADPGGPVRIRRDSSWSVPEPELALVLSPQLKVVGYTVGNDMSARDIEGENPLYLPQAKVYDHACALGPLVTLAAAMPPAQDVTIRLLIERGSRTAFDGTTRLTEMARPLAELVEWLGRENTFPHGAVLLTGTGIVPPDDFTLAAGDLVTIEITGIGRLTNRVEQQA